MIIITGPTATGKTSRAVSLAKTICGEIISADSRQVYRRMDIGTGKDLKEYGNVPYHLIDIAEPGEVYNLYRFLSDSRVASSEIIGRGHTPIICGGSGMYVEAFAKGTVMPEVPRDEELRDSLKGKSLSELRDILAQMKSLHNTTDTDTLSRAIRAIEIQTFYKRFPEQAVNTGIDPGWVTPLIIGVYSDRESRREHISKRLASRLNEGMVHEVSSLIESGVKPESLIAYGLEYKFITKYLLGEFTYEEMVKKLEIAIHQFAKRQMTWFRGMERRGLKVEWLDSNLSDVEFTSKVLELYGDKKNR